MLRSSLPSVRILIVDDDPGARFLLSEALEARGAEVRALSDARDAGRAVREWLPDVLVSDIAMPHVDGYDLIRRVRRSEPAHRQVAAIACTGYAAPADRRRAVDAGFDAVVPKPVDLDLLVGTIAHFSEVRGETALPPAEASGRSSASGVARSRSEPDS